jgi:hypothetical protein
MRIICINFEDVAKTIKFNCALCAAAEKVTSDSVLNSKYFIHTKNSWWPTQKLLIPHHSPVAPWRPYGPLRITLLKNPICSSLDTGGTYVSIHTKFYHFLTDFSETLNMYSECAFYP